MRGGITNNHSIAYSFSNISAKNYQNWLMCIEVIAWYVIVVFLRHSVYLFKHNYGVTVYVSVSVFSTKFIPILSSYYSFYVFYTAHSSVDSKTNGQTDTHTNTHTDMLITILRFHWGRVAK